MPENRTRRTTASSETRRYRSSSERSSSSGGSSRGSSRTSGQRTSGRKSYKRRSQTSFLEVVQAVLLGVGESLVGLFAGGESRGGSGRGSGGSSRGVAQKGVREILIANVILFGILFGAEAWSASRANISFDIKDNNAVEVEYGSDFDVSNVVATYREPLHPSRTQRVECSFDGDLNTKKMGTYEITVDASYKKAKAEVKEKVTVVDSTAPEITFQGSDTETVMAGHVFRDPGYSAKDLLDGDVTESVEISGNLDLMTPGTYERVYTVSDSHGNTATKTRTVVVTENDGSGISEELEAKTIYLTFDDGPWKYTEELLDILDRYNAKVTFFVTNQYPDYIDMIAEEAKRGHTVAVHTYSHDYGKIYSSTAAFYEDMDKMAAIIKEQTGEQPWLSRFPGGGSNTISRKYCDGIMTALTNGLADHGYLYADWNVVSGDAGDTTSTDKVISNVINGVKNCSGAAIVLQHDIKDFSVNAVEEILKWGQENGYVFRAMTELSTMPHQSVNN